MTIQVNMVSHDQEQPLDLVPMTPRSLTHATIPIATPDDMCINSSLEQCGETSSCKKRRINGSRTFPLTPPHLLYSRKTRRIEGGYSDLSPSLFFPEFLDVDDFIETPESNGFRLFQRKSILPPEYGTPLEGEDEGVLDSSLFQQISSTRELQFPHLEIGKALALKDIEYPSVHLKPRNIRKCRSMDSVKQV